MQYADIIKERYSCRKFGDTQLTDDQLLTILNSGRIAPSAKNCQPWRFLVLQTPEELAQVDECSPCRRNAQTAILVCFDRDASFKNEKVVPDYGWLDASYAILQMSLAATDLGLGSCIVGMYDLKRAVELFNIPENIVPYQFLMLGEPDMGPAAAHFECMELGDIVTYGKF